MEKRFINRDISWLYFNGRVLHQAARPDVPLLERFRFLSIFSSNLDEFYRVRMPAVRALSALRDDDNGHLQEDIAALIKEQQLSFGNIVHTQLLPLLEQHHVHFLYGKPLPAFLEEPAQELLLNRLSAFLQLVWLTEQPAFFPQNNSIYMAFDGRHKDRSDVLIVNIPSEAGGRYFTSVKEGAQYIVLIDDIIRTQLATMLPGVTLQQGYSFKITRDADLDLQDEFKGDLAARIEDRIAKRDFGLATRFLYDASMPQALKDKLVAAFQLKEATQAEGGAYHNLRDLAALPVNDDALSYDYWKPHHFPLPCGSIFDCLDQKDILVSVPYQGYQRVLQFFNQSAVDPYVTDIFVTLYRIAGDSLIANALITAARNGKQVTVFVELKARFDEANNIQWAKKMKAAGVKIIYSIPALKVHAKVALAKRNTAGRSRYYGVFSTGNFNESTARFYTDHILLTTHKEMLREAELLFLFLAKRRKPTETDTIAFRHLLVAQFNLQSEFLRLIDNETALARQGKPASITIKLNNLEEEVLINKLYEASQQGVRVCMLVRSICRIRPGVPGLSENIEVHRIVDRYLEHPRVFIFGNDGDPLVFAGSADWMNRNIYRRIEVCFPVYDAKLKQCLCDLLEIQWADRESAVKIDENGYNVTMPANVEQAASQEQIYNYFKKELL